MFAEDQKYSNVTLRSMQVDQTARRLQQIAKVRSLLHRFPQNSNVDISFSKYLVISQQYLNEVDRFADLIMCLAGGNEKECRHLMPLKLVRIVEADVTHRETKEELRQCFEAEIKNFEHPNLLTKSYTETSEAMERAIRTKESQLSKQ